MPFEIQLSHTTETLERFHRTLMDRRQTIPWDDFDRTKYDPELVEYARHQWAGRAVAEYQSTAQFAQLLHRLTIAGAPINIIGAATRLATDECRHAEYCARMADALGGREDHQVDGGLSLFEDEEDIWMAIYRSVLNVCCFGETLSIPMLESIHMVATDELPQTVARIISSDEEYHARFGWDVLSWLTPEMSDTQLEWIQARLPYLMSHFEKVCAASPEVLERLAGQEVDVFEGSEDEPNLGTLTDEQYAAIFYHTLEHTIFPGLTELGFDAIAAWQQRPILVAEAP